MKTIEFFYTIINLPPFQNDKKENIKILKDSKNIVSESEMEPCTTAPPEPHIHTAPIYVHQSQGMYHNIPDCQPPLQYPARPVPLRVDTMLTACHLKFCVDFIWCYSHNHYNKTLENHHPP